MGSPFLQRMYGSLKSQSQSYVTTDGQSASLSWNKAPIWGLWPDLYYWQLHAFWCGALSLTRGRVCHLPESQSAVVSLLSVCTIYILHVIKRMYVCMYIKYIQGLGQFRMSTADHTLLLVAPATTAVESLKRSYAWLPPSLSLLYFWLSSNLLPCLQNPGTDHVENTALILLLSCLLLRERVHWSAVQKRPWCIRPSRCRCIATALQATIG
jgi:hypothetical protein